MRANFSRRYPPGSLDIPACTLLPHALRCAARRIHATAAAAAAFTRSHARMHSKMVNDARDDKPRLALSSTAHRISATALHRAPELRKALIDPLMCAFGRPTRALTRAAFDWAMSRPIPRRRCP